MGRKTFRLLTAGLAMGLFVCASPAGAMIGFLAIWAVIIGAAPLMIAAAFIPGAQDLKLPTWTPAAVLAVLGLAVIAAGARALIAADQARRAGAHDAARASALKGLAVASLPLAFLLSVRSLEAAWP